MDLLKWKKLDEAKRNLDYSIMKKYLSTIVDIYPHLSKTGAPVLGSMLVSYQRALFAYARNGTFEFALEILLDFIDEVIEETGWKVVHPDSLADIWDAEIHCNSKFDHSQVTQTLVLLSYILEYGWATDIMVKANLDLSVPEIQAKYGSMMNVEHSIYQAVKSGIDSIPLFDDALALKFFSTISKLTPPMLRKSYSPNAPIERNKISTAAQVTLLASCQRVFSALMLLHGSTTFKGFPQRAFNLHFGRTNQKSLFDDVLRPEVILFYYYNPENPMEMFETLQKLLLSTKSTPQISAISIAYGRALNSWLIQGFPQRKFPATSAFKIFASQLSDSVRAKSPIIDKRDLNFHVLILKLAIIADADGKWWENVGKSPPRWYKYLRHYQSRLSSRETYLPAFEFSSQVAWFSALYNVRGINAEQAAGLKGLMVGLYAPLRDCLMRFSPDNLAKRFSTLFDYHAGFAMLSPDAYFRDHYSNLENQQAMSLMASIMATSSRLMSFDLGKDTWIPGYSSSILSGVAYAADKSLVAGPDRMCFSRTFAVGSVIIFKAGVYGVHFCCESIKGFCTTMVRTFNGHSINDRELAISGMIRLMNSPNNDLSSYPLEIVKGIYHLFSDLLQDSKKVLRSVEYIHGDNERWNLTLVRDILEARVAITKRLLELDPKGYKIDVKLERTIRTALTLCICSTDRHITARAIECTKQLSDEITCWSEAHLSLDDFMKDSSHIKDFWNLIVNFAPTDPSDVTHSLSMRKIIHLFYDKFSVPPITDWFIDLIKAGLDLWQVILQDVNGKLSPTSRKTLVNIMILITGISQAARRSPIPEHRALVRQIALMMSEGLSSANSNIRDSTVTIARLTVVPDAQFAISVIADVYNGWVAPRLAVADKPRDMSLQEYKGWSALANEAIVLYRTAAETTDFVEYDASKLPNLMFEYCSHMHHKHPTSVSEPFFRINIELANAPHLLYASKFDTFDTVVSTIVDELQQYPNHKCLSLMSQTLAVLLDDYTLYSAPNSTFSVFDKRYQSFRKLLGTLSRYLEPSSTVSAETAKNFEMAIIRLCVANQDMTITYFEESELLSDRRPRNCIYQSFTTIFSEEADPNNQQEYDEIIGLLLQDMIILEGMCEICPQEDARDFTAHISTLFGEHGQVVELGKWAFERDLAAAQNPEEVMRKNNINVWIVIQIFFAHLKPFYRLGIRNLIRKVYQNPYIFHSLGEDLDSKDSYKATMIGNDLYRSCIDYPTKCFGTPILKLVKFIVEKSEERFPGSSDTIFRNLLLLRVTCPMIVQPQNFGIMSHSPEGIIRDSLIQLVKSMQKIDFNNLGAPKVVLFVAKQLQELKHTMIERSKVETTNELYNHMFTSDVINQSFYSIKQFLYRHSRELQAYLFIHAGASATPAPGQEGVHDMTTMSNGVKKDVRLLDGFSQLLHKLGRPNMGLLERTGRHRSSHNNCIRKNSSMAWNCADDPIFELTHVEDTTYLVVNLGSNSWPTTTGEHFFQNEILSRINQMMPTGTNKCVTAFADNTWVSLSTQTLMMMREQLEPALEHFSFKINKLYHLNTSFAFFQTHVNIPQKPNTGSPIDHQFVTSLDFTPERLRESGHTDNTIMTVRDIQAAEKFENIRLEYLGASSVFTVYIGVQFIHVVSGFNSCDIFTVDCVRFINGSIHLKKHNKAFFVEFTVKVGDSTALFQKKLWNVLNNTRNNRHFVSPHPLVEVSPQQFHTYLLCYCLMDLCSENESTRWHAYNLLPQVIAKFRADSNIDLSLQTLSWQPQRVAEISKDIASAHPSLVFDVLQSFISITSYTGKLDETCITLILPWLERLPSAVLHDCNKSVSGGNTRLQRLTRSLFSLSDTLFESNRKSAELLKVYIWPHLMNSPIAPQVVDVFMACNAFKIEGLQETQSQLTEGISTSSAVLRHLVKSVFEFVYDGYPGNSGEIAKWSDNLAWSRIKVNLMTFAGCVFSGPKQIMELLPQIIVVLFTFSSVGPVALRKSMHRLMNSVINHCAMAPGLSRSGRDQLWKLQTEINSDNGLLLFGVHTSTNDEEYDIFDGIPFGDSTKLGNCLIDLCNTILPPNELASLRSKVLEQFYESLPFGNAAFHRRIYFGILTFTNSKLTAEQIVVHLKFFVTRIMELLTLNIPTRSRYISMSMQLYQIHCERLLIWLDDSSVGRYIWVSMGLQSLMVEPALKFVVMNLNTCMRICQLRGLHSDGISKLLAGPCGDSVRSWWDRHSEVLLPVPNPSQNFAASISYPLIPLMRDIEARKTALDACEGWLTIYDNDTSIDSTLELALLYYIFAPEDRLLARSHFFGVYADGIDEEDLVEKTKKKLARKLAADDIHTIPALVSVCQVLDAEAVVTPSIRFLRLLVEIGDNGATGHVWPIIMPLCANIVPLLEYERPNIAVEMSEAIDQVQRYRMDSYQQSLEVVQQALARVGRPKDVDDDFVLHPPRVYQYEELQTSGKMMLAGDLVKNVIDTQAYLLENSRLASSTTNLSIEPEELD